jgi:hypothetical protein
MSASAAQMGEETRQRSKRLVSTFLQTYYAALSRQLEDFHRFYLDARGAVTCESIFRGVTLPWVPLQTCEHPDESPQDLASGAEKRANTNVQADWNGTKFFPSGSESRQDCPGELRLTELNLDPNQPLTGELVSRLQAVNQNSLPVVYSEMRVSSYDLDIYSVTDDPGWQILNGQVVVVGSIHVSDTPRSVLGTKSSANIAMKYVAMFPFIQIFKLTLKHDRLSEELGESRLAANGRSTSHIWIQKDVLRYLDSNILHWLPISSRPDYSPAETAMPPPATIGASDQEVAPLASQGAPPYAFVPSPQPIPFVDNFHRFGMVPFLSYPMIGAPGPQPLISGDAARIMSGRYGAPPFMPSHPIYGVNAVMTPSNMSMASVVKTSDDLPFACTIWVGGLPPGSSEELIRAEFSRFGPVHKVDYRPSRGFAFIVFVSEKARDRAIELYRSGNFVPATPHFENAYLKIDYKREFGNRSGYPVYRMPNRYQGRVLQHSALHQLASGPTGDFAIPLSPGMGESPREVGPGSSQSPTRTPTLPSR